MIYVVYKSSAYKRDWEIEEFEIGKDAVNFLRGMPKNRIIGVFEGVRLEPIMGRRRIVKQAVVGLEEFKEEEKE